MSEKIIRDPVHDVIAFRIDRPGEALLFRLVNAPEMQRLRRVRQLGMASLAYPGADHSRYSHSLGVMETARKILGRLGEFFELDPERELLCLVASLLHDVGHGPFSHTFERVSGVRHEEVTRRVILDPESEVHRTLAEFDAGLPGRLVEFMDGVPAARSFYHDILASQLDADRIDYLLRDNLMTGSQYGGFDLRWVLQALTIDPSSNRLAVAAKGVSAVEGYLQARYHMYRHVYFHKVVRSAEGMVKLALQRGRRLAVQERLAWPPRGHAVHKALMGQALAMAEFAEFDDVSILHCFKVWAGGDDVALAQLCRGLLYRRLFKVVDISAIDDDQRARDAMVAAEQAVARAGGDRSYDLFFDEPANTPYGALEIARPSHEQQHTSTASKVILSEARDLGARTTEILRCAQDDREAHERSIEGRDGLRPEAGILVLEEGGRARDFAQISPLVGALNRQLMFRRVHVAEEWRGVVRDAVGVGASREEKEKDYD